MKKIKVVFLLAVTSMMLSACGQVKNYDARIEYEEKVSEYLEKQQYSGVALVATKDGIIYEERIGYCDEEELEAIELTTVFEAGSLTKQMTAAAILKMDAEKLLSIDDDLSKYFPKCSWAGDITIRDLLNMNTCIPDYMSNEQIVNVKSQEELETLILSTELEKEVTGYSNSNYYLLGSIIEQVSGQSFAEYMEENFFKEIGMHHTQMGCTEEDKFPAMKAKESYPYYVTYSAGSLCTNIYDLYQWEKAYFGGKVLPEQYFLEVLETNNGTYLYGLQCADGVYYHQGETMNFVSYMGYDTKTGVQIILLSNRSDTDISEICANVWKATADYMK